MKVDISITSPSVALSNRMANMSLVAMLLIVLRHTGGTPSCSSVAWFLALTKDGVSHIGVPWFFFAAGYFIMNGIERDGWYFNSVRKRVHSLLVPYVSWSLIMSVFVYGLTKVSNCTWSYESVWAWAGHAFGLSSVQPAYNALWFLRALMVLVLFAPLMVGVARSWLLMTAFFVLAWFSLDLEALCGLPVNFFDFVIPLGGMFYFALGIACRIWGLSMNFRLRYHLVALTMGLVLFSLVFGLKMRVFRWPGIALAVFGMWGLIPETEWPKWLTKSSFPIYLMHVIFNIAIGGVLKRFGVYNWSTQSIFNYLVATCVLVALSVGTTLLLRKVCSPVARILFGGR